LQVSFAKEPYQRDCILQKRPTILRSLLIVAIQVEYKTIENTLKVQEGGEYSLTSLKKKGKHPLKRKYSYL